MLRSHYPQKHFVFKFESVSTANFSNTAVGPHEYHLLFQAIVPLLDCGIAPQFLFQIFLQSFSCFKSHPRISQLLFFCRECVSCPTSLEMWKPQMLRCSYNTSFAFNAVSRVQELVNLFMSSRFCFHFFSVPPRLGLRASDIQSQCLPEDGGARSILSYTSSPVGGREAFLCEL